MSRKTLLLEIKDSIATVTLNRPEVHNAFDDVLIELMIETLETLNTDDSVRLVCLKANGKNFSAGADLNWMRRMANYSIEENFTDSMQLAKLMHMLYSLEKPTIAIVQGKAIGGGVGLIACSDIVIAEDNASFCFSEVKIGLIPAVISPYVIKAMSLRACQRYFLTAESFTAVKAQELGLVHEVVTIDELESAASAICHSILQNGFEAVKAAKALIHDICEMTIDANMLKETAKRIANIRVSEESQKAMTAFLDKKQT